MKFFLSICAVSLSIAFSNAQSKADTMVKSCPAPGKVDSTLVQQKTNVAYFDDNHNQILSATDGELYGAISCSEFEKAISYAWPIRQVVIYEHKNYKVHKSYQVFHSYTRSEKTVLVVNYYDNTVTIYQPKNVE